MNLLLRPALVLAGAILISTAAHAQNAAVVNGKPIPSSRVDEFIQALSQQGVVMHQGHGTLGLCAAVCSSTHDLTPSGPRYHYTHHTGHAHVALCAQD